MSDTAILLPQPAAGIVLVGESNPYGADPDFALYPAPDGCGRKHYLESFRRVNLCCGKWSQREARKTASALTTASDKLILLGSKVASAFGVEFLPFLGTSRNNLLVLPHPSGLCRLWNRPGAVALAREAVGKFAPELAHLLGRESHR